MERGIDTTIYNRCARTWTLSRTQCAGGRGRFDCRATPRFSLRRYFARHPHQLQVLGDGRSMNVDESCGFHLAHLFFHDRAPDEFAPGVVKVFAISFHQTPNGGEVTSSLRHIVSVFTADANLRFACY